MNYPKADLWLQNEFVGCNLPVPITVKTYSGGSSERVGAGSGPAPIRPVVVFYYLFDPESFESVGSHITIQLVDFSLKRAVPFGTIKFQAYLKICNFGRVLSDDLFVSGFRIKDWTP